MPFELGKIGEALTGLSNIPPKLLCSVFAVAGLMFWLPSPLLGSQPMEAFRQEYGVWIGLVVLVSGALLTAEAACMVFGHIKTFVSKRRRSAQILSAFERIDDAERAVLREFVIQARSSIQMPMTDPIVSGLRTKQLLDRVSNFGMPMLCGPVFTFALPDEIRDTIAPSELGFPDAEPTEAEIAWLQKRRPDWVYAIRDWNERMNRTF